MNPCYDEDRPDPAAHLLAGEREAWNEYRGRRGADPEMARRWRFLVSEIERVREAAGWPRLRE